MLSCQGKENTTIKTKDEFLKASDLYSKVYFISTELKSEKCVAYNDGCDCCDGKIVFLKGNIFISDYYCIPEESFSTGTFEIKNGKLFLHHNNIGAVLGPKNIDSIDEDSVLRLDSLNYGIDSLAVFKCKKKYLFKTKLDYYSESTKTTFSEAINDFKKNGVWKLLKIKD